MHCKQLGKYLCELEGKSWDINKNKSDYNSLSWVIWGFFIFKLLTTVIPVNDTLQNINYLKDVLKFKCQV